MKIVKTNFKYNLLDLKKDEYIKIIKRKSPNNSHIFFKTLFKSLSSASGFVKYSSASRDIERILQNKFSSSIRLTPFYKSWINDMGDVCKVFCKFLNDNKISFWIGTQRGCSRFHVNMETTTSPLCSNPETNLIIIEKFTKNFTHVTHIINP